MSYLAIAKKAEEKLKGEKADSPQEQTSPTPEALAAVYV